MGESPDSWLRLGAELAAEFGGGLRYWLRVAPFGWVLALMPLVIARMARAELSTAEAVALGTGSYPEATRMQVLARLSSGSLSASSRRRRV